MAREGSISMPSSINPAGRSVAGANRAPRRDGPAADPVATRSAEVGR